MDIHLFILLFMNKLNYLLVHLVNQVILLLKKCLLLLIKVEEI